MYFIYKCDIYFNYHRISLDSINEFHETKRDNENKPRLFKHTRFTYQSWLIDFLVNFRQTCYIFCYIRYCIIYIYISDQLKKHNGNIYIYIYCYTLHETDELWTNVKPTIFFTDRSSIFIVGGYKERLMKLFAGTDTTVS